MNKSSGAGGFSKRSERASLLVLPIVMLALGGFLLAGLSSKGVEIDLMVFAIVGAVFVVVLGVVLMVVRAGHDEEKPSPHKHPKSHPIE